jgi:hypothetical protein
VLHYNINSRGISYSVVFEDMFTIAKPDGEGSEGCLVVHLSDSAEDLRIVLEVLHDSIQR